MFGRRRKSECHRVREMFSPYLDDRVACLERDAVKYHIEICDDCEWELRSLEATAQLLSRIPVASVPRSFTLAKAPPRWDWVILTHWNMNRLRVATAAAVFVLAVLLAGDFSGLLHRDPIVAQHPPQQARQEEIVRDVEEPDLPAQEETPVVAVGDPPREIPEAREPMPSEHPLEERGITRRVEPGEEIPETAFPGMLVMPPEARPPLREPYPWLLPFQITSAALVIVFGVANLLVWQRKRRLSLLRRS